MQLFASMISPAPYGKEYEYFQTGDYAYGSNDDRDYFIRDWLPLIRQFRRQFWQKRYSVEKLRIIFTGGAHLDPYYIDRFAEYGVEVLEGYGMSECSPVISNNTLEKQ